MCWLASWIRSGLRWAENPAQVSAPRACAKSALTCLPRWVRTLAVRCALIWLSRSRRLGTSGLGCWRRLWSARGMPRCHTIMKLQIDIGLERGLVVNDKIKTACRQNEKPGWKRCPAGAGVLFQICGEKDFVILKNSQNKRGIPRYLAITKQKMDTD